MLHIPLIKVKGNNLFEDPIVLISLSTEKQFSNACVNYQEYRTEF